MPSSTSRLALAGAGSVFDTASRELNLASIGFEQQQPAVLARSASSVQSMLNARLEQSKHFVKALSSGIGSTAVVKPEEKLAILVFAALPAAVTTTKGEALHYLESKVHTWTAVLLREKKQLILEAPTSVQHLQRDALSSLLDIAETLGCESVFAAVKKAPFAPSSDAISHEQKELIKGLNFVGFDLVHPRVKSMNDFVLMSMEL